MLHSKKMSLFSNIFQYSLSVILFLAPFSNSFSNGTPMNGFYAGMEFGDSLAYANQNIENSLGLQLSNTFQSTQSFNVFGSTNRNSVIGAMFAGYGRTFKQFYLGGEIAGSNTDYNMSLSSSNGISRSIQNTVTIAGTEQVMSSISVSPLQFEIYLKPGLMLTPNTLLYSRFGATFATVRYLVQASGSRVLEQNGNNEFEFPINLTAVKTTRKAGFQFGPGIEQSLSDHVSLRLDYLFTYYGKFSMSSSTQFAEDPFIIKANGFQSVGIYAQSVMLGLSYHI